MRTKGLDDAGGSQIPPIVLVVEDDRDTRDMYEALLNAEGFWVLKVADAVEAMEYAKDFHPDAVLTDLGLPGGSDGADLIRDLRADPDFEFTPIIAVTGRQPRELPSLRGLELSAVLLKPVSPAALVERLTAALHDSTVLRARSAALLERLPVLRERSSAAMGRSSRSAAAAAGRRARPCPRCVQPLTWFERSRVGEEQIDYFEPCERGCGLFSFNWRTEQFQELAPKRAGSNPRGPGTEGRD